MTHPLPAHFPFEALSSSDKFKVKAFYHRFVEDYQEYYGFGHFLMAAYASLPALLTPDLMHKIWQNFNTYHWGGTEQRIHRIAAPDILLSPLCREMGYELYEMYEPIRQAFSTWFHRVYQQEEWQEVGVIDPDRIAKFVHEYHAQGNPGTARWGAAYHEPQLRDALAYLAPDIAQERLLEQLRTAVDQKRESEVVQVLNNIGALDRRVDIIYRSKDNNAAPGLRSTARFAEAWKALIQKYDAGFLKRFKEEPGLKQLLKRNNEGLGIAVALDEQTIKEVENVVPASLYALLIGVNRHEKPWGQELRGCINDVNNVQQMLDIYREKNTSFQYPSYLVRTDDQATSTIIQDDLNHIFSTSKDGDSIIIYFSGRELYNSRGRILTYFDSQKAGEDSTGLYQSELEESLLNVILQKRVHILLVMDTCFNITPEQYQPLLQNKLRTNTAPLKGSMVIYFASEVGKVAKEKPVNGETFGVFTRALLDIIAQHELLDYQTILEKIQQIIKDDQIPFLEAYGPAAAYYEFLTGRPGKQVFSLQYQEDKWVLSAGRNQGLTPSVGFVLTLVRTNTGVELVVGEVDSDTALIEIANENIAVKVRELVSKNDLTAAIAILYKYYPDEDEVILLSSRYVKMLNDLKNGTIEDEDASRGITKLRNLTLHFADNFTSNNLNKELQYECILVQKAPERIIVLDKSNSILKDLDPEQKNSSNEMFTYFRMVQNHPNPHYLLKENYLYKEEGNVHTALILSMIQLSAQGLKDRIEITSRYLMLQKIEGRPIGLKEKVKIRLEKIEGREIDFNNIDDLPGALVEGNELELNCILDGSRILPPAFRCSLEIDQLNQVHIYPFLFAEDDFSVKRLGTSASEIDNAGVNYRDTSLVLEPEFVKILFPKGENNFHSCLLESELFNRSVKTETNYTLTIILSKKQLDLRAFAQNGMDVYKEDVPALPSQEARLKIEEWDTIRIPIKVIRKDRSLNSFVDAEKQETKNNVYLLSANKLNEWSINCGALHGLSIEPGTVKEFEIYEELDGKILGIAKVERVGLQYCTVSLDTTLDLDRSYIAKLISALSTLYTIALKATDKGKKRYEAYLNTQNLLDKEKFILVENLQDSKYRVDLDFDLLDIYDQTTNTLIKRIGGDDDDSVFELAIDLLERIANWEKSLALDNRNTQFNLDAFKIIAKHSETGLVLSPGVTDPAEPNIEIINAQVSKNVNGRYILPIDFELNNSTSGTLFYKALYFSQHYGVMSLNGDYFTFDEISPQDKFIQPQALEFELPKGESYETNIIKFIVSTAKIDEEFLLQEEIEKPGETVEFWKSKNIGEFRAKERNLVKKGDHKKSSVPDWFCKTIVFKLTPESN